MEKRLLFVCGFPSGGTDLLKTILNAHPEIYLNGEMPLLWKIADYGYQFDTKFLQLEDIREFQSILRKLNIWNNIENIDHDFSAELMKRGELSLNDVLYICFSKNNRLIWGNKTPQNTENIDKLSAVFPDAIFLIIVRDVRDVCLSWSNKWGKDITLCADKWSSRMERGYSYASQLDANRTFFVKFESLLGDSEPTIRGICSFLQLSFSTRMIEHEKYTSNNIDGKRNYGREIIVDNMNKWRTQLSGSRLKRIEEITYDGMKFFDYKIMQATEPITITSTEIFWGKGRDGLALVFVGNRARKNNSLIQRGRDLCIQLKKLTS